VADGAGAPVVDVAVLPAEETGRADARCTGRDAVDRGLAGATVWGEAVAVAVVRLGACEAVAVGVGVGDGEAAGHMLL